MDEAQFEGHLAAAFSQPSEAPGRPDLVAQILARVERRRLRRLAILAVAALVGVSAAAVAIAATGVGAMVARAVARVGPEPAAIDPAFVLTVGFVLILAAVARNELREF